MHQILQKSIKWNRFYSHEGHQGGPGSCRVQVLGRRTLHSIKVPWSEPRPETRAIIVIKLHSYWRSGSRYTWKFCGGAKWRNRESLVWLLPRYKLESNYWALSLFKYWRIKLEKRHPVVRAVTSKTTNAISMWLSHLVLSEVWKFSMTTEPQIDLTDFNWDVEFKKRKT